MQVASTSVVGFGFGSGEAQHGQMFFRFAPKADLPPDLRTTPAPTLRERRHRGLARRLVAVFGMRRVAWPRPA
jgi:predicted cobalt transporter CbtA